MWIAAFATFAMNIVLPYTQKQNTSDIVGFAFYVALFRSSWALALSWLIFACVKGYGAPINWFLSLPFFQHLSRLSYSIYLVHFPIIMYSASLQRTLNYYNGFTMIMFYVGIVAFSLLVAIPIVLVVEMPFISLEAGVNRNLRQQKLRGLEV